MQNEQDYAIVIGISHYKALEKLEGPVEDAKEFLQWLIDENGGNLPPTNCFLIESTPNPMRPLQDDIDEKLATIYEMGSTSGYRRLYFYFAGHGLGVDWKENALCLPQWSKVRLNYALSSYEYLNLVIKSGFFKEAFFFLDCCRNRRPGARPLHPTLGIEQSAEEGFCNSFVAYAAEFNNAAYEAEHWNENKTLIRGYFTRALLEGLRGAASNQEGVVTTASIKGFLKTKVEEIAQSHNQFQSVRYEDRFANESVIIGKPPNTQQISLQITFQEQGNIVLENQQLDVIKQSHSSTGPWTFELDKGIYCLRNTNTNKEAYIRLDGTTREVFYQF